MTLICLIAPSGSGKTTLAEALVPAGIDTIRSYTTRPMRPGEQNGREHIFVTEAEAIHLLTTQRPLAYTLFGGYRYFALWSQIAPSPSILTYVIDERGYHTLTTKIVEHRYELQDRYGIQLPDIHLLPIRIERSEADLAATIDPARRHRDADRHASGSIPYRIIIHNDAPTAAHFTEWAQQQLSPALGVWLTHPTHPPRLSDPASHITTQMSIGHIIANLTGAL